LATELNAMPTRRPLLTVRALCLAGVVAMGVVGCAARSSLPRLSNTMYDWDLPPVVAAEPVPTLCPAVIQGLRVRPPDRANPVAAECIDRYAAIAADVLHQYEASDDTTVRAACADILTRLWLRRRLPGAIKHRLVDRYAGIAIGQELLPRPGLNLRVTTATSFPFPSVIFTVRSLRYRNGRPEQGLLASSKTAALAQRTVQLAGMSTAADLRGNSYAFDVVLDEMAGNAVVWRKVIRTKWITVR
jgi:hypothetical protein